jgi:hypothetical protein
MAKTLNEIIEQKEAARGVISSSTAFYIDLCMEEMFLRLEHAMTVSGQARSQSTLAFKNELERVEGRLNGLQKLLGEPVTVRRLTKAVELLRQSDQAVGAGDVGN